MQTYGYFNEVDPGSGSCRIIMQVRLYTIRVAFGLGLNPDYMFTSARPSVMT